MTTPSPAGRRRWAGVLNVADRDPLPVVGAGERRGIRLETLLVLGISLGASAIWSALSLIKKLTAQVSLSAQTTQMNTSVAADRPWLDLAYQLTGVVLGVAPALLALHLLTRDGTSLRTLGLDRRRPWRDAGLGVGLAACVGIPGLGLYLAARALGLNTAVAAANLTDHWWTGPVLVRAAAQNAVLEEVVMIGYLLTRWRQSGGSVVAVLIGSALIRGGYHLYQGFGGFIGNAVMGVLFGLVYLRTKRVMPLVICHALLDIFAFVGYTLLKPYIAWL